VPGGFLARAQTFEDGSARNAPLRRVAEWVAAHTREGDRIYVWGFEPLLYQLADRRPASRYIYNAPQRARWSRLAARTTLMQDLRATPPAAILVEHGDIHPGTAASDIDSASELRRFARLRRLLDEEYVPSAQIDRFTIHLRKSEAASPPRA
jgi:hypothetical protein